MGIAGGEDVRGMRTVRMLRWVGKKREEEEWIHRRSIAETAMYRFKVLMGEKEAFLQEL